MRLVASERIWSRVFVIDVLDTETKYCTRGIPYKFALLDRPKIRRFGIFAITFFWKIQIRPEL